MEIEQISAAVPMVIHQRFYREPIEILRTALCALTYRTPHQFEPVYVGRIKSCCERFGLSEDVKPYLDILQLLREYEDLGGGYWTPTPQRLVKFPGCSIVISPNTTSELQRWYPGAIEIAGFGRVVVPGGMVALPEQTADDWIGSPINLTQWVQDQLKYSKENLHPTVHPDGHIEVYRPWTYSTGSGRARWIALEEINLDISNELLLCRIKGFTGSRWFFAITRASRVVEECEVSHDQKLRLLYGLDAMHGTSTEVRAIKVGHRRGIKLKIPQEERRLLLALAQQGECDERGYYEYEFDPRYSPAIEFDLKHLGISLRG
jgi:hypothetical protein